MIIVFAAILKNLNGSYTFKHTRPLIQPLHIRSQADGRMQECLLYYKLIEIF
jgi:hypothetical protein